jgi:starvation-inducible DNA-binding protein
MGTATATKLHATKNDLAEGQREAAIGLLQQRLASAIDVQLQAKQAHWNVKGPNFIALHELFDAVVGEATGWVDEIAERLVALGGTADGRAQTVAAKSSIPAYPAEIQAGADHVEALATSLAAFGKSVREGIGTAGDAGDAGTQDLFTEVSREVDKQLWFVESHNR